MRDNKLGGTIEINCGNISQVRFCSGSVYSSLLYLVLYTPVRFNNANYDQIFSNRVPIKVCCNSQIY